jgi:DNA-binding NarL/FixJ family response regulator
MHAAPYTAPPGTPSDQHRSALLVEDEPLFQDLIAQAFRALGRQWDLQVFGSGREALGHLRTLDRAPDLAVIDLGLPDIEGIEVIRQLKRVDPSALIMVASVHADERHVLGAIRAGACGYLLKDDPALAIADALRRVVEGEYPISPSLARHLFKLATQPAAAEAAGPQIALAPREIELLRLFSDGCSYQRAARAMDVSMSTIQTYVRRIYEKLDADSKIAAVSSARARGLLP